MTQVMPKSPGNPVPAAISVSIVEDSKAVRDALRRQILNDPALEVVGETESAQEAVTIITSLEPDVVVLDIRLKQGTGIDVCRSLQAAGVRTKVLVMSGYWDAAYVSALSKLGVTGYISKMNKLADIPAAIRKVAEGWTVFCPEVSSIVAEHLQHCDQAEPVPLPGTGLLTLREHQVLELRDRGLKNVEIACTLGVSTKTVESHVHSITLKSTNQVAAGVS